MSKLKVNIEWVKAMCDGADKMESFGMSRADVTMFVEKLLFKKAIGGVDIESDAVTRVDLLRDYIEHYMTSQERLVEKSRALDKNATEFVDAVGRFGYGPDVDMNVVKKDGRCKEALAMYKEPMFSPNVIFDVTKDWRRSSYDSQALVRGSLECFYKQSGLKPSQPVQSFLDDTKLFDSLTEEFEEKSEERRIPDVSEESLVMSYQDDCDGYYGEDY